MYAPRSWRDAADTSQTTSLPPATVAGARASIAYQMEHIEDRQGQHINVAHVKALMATKGLPAMANRTHIIPVLVGDATLAKAASDLLLRKHNIYVQSISASPSLAPWTSYAKTAQTSPPSRLGRSDCASPPPPSTLLSRRSP